MASPEAYSIRGRGREYKPEGRQRIATGVSPWIGVRHAASPRRGRQKHWPPAFCRPLRGLALYLPEPTAHAVGYHLPPAQGGLNTPTRKPGGRVSLAPT